MKTKFKLILTLCLFGLIVFSSGCISSKESPVTPRPTPPVAITEPTLPWDTRTPYIKQTSIPPTPLVTKYFNNYGISFDYPAEFQSLTESSLQSMRGVMAKQGIELITVLTSADGRKTIQIARQPNTASIDSLYAAKKQVADQVNAQGMEMMGTKFVKYTVERVQLSPNQKAVLGYAEDSTGKTGINYAIPVKGYEYAVIFLYTTSSDGDTDSLIREQLIESLEFN
jgi:hypothetical protein